jgi:biotin synthase-related radical SAM superfamily protein
LSVPVEFSYSTDEGANIEFMYVNSTEINVKRLAIILRTYSQIKLSTRRNDSIDTMGKFLDTMSEIIGSGWNNITK